MKFDSNMLSNYRDQYRARYGEDWPGTDQTLREIIADVFGADAAETDMWRVEEMRQQQKEVGA